jgi:hypothetical protein
VVPVDREVVAPGQQPDEHEQQPEDGRTDRDARHRVVGPGDPAERGVPVRPRHHEPVTPVGAHPRRDHLEEHQHPDQRDGEAQ